MSYEATKAYKRRGFKYPGRGIDIGAGPDGLSKKGLDCYDWDLADGDAQYLASVKDGTYDWLHSSHCLEHMVDVPTALKNWIRVVRTGGYLVITVPDFELYERGNWPSKFNSDHKWNFRIFNGTRGNAKSINVFDLLKKFYLDVEIIKVERIEDGFDWSLGSDTDQTSGPAECCIEIVLRKKC